MTCMCFLTNIGRLCRCYCCDDQIVEGVAESFCPKDPNRYDTNIVDGEVVFAC